MDNRIKKKSAPLTQKILLVLVTALMAAVLLLSGLSHNTVTRSRAVGDYTIAENVTLIRQGDTSEYRFTLGDIGHGETLAFFINHHELSVYVGDACVYTLEAEHEDAFATSGGTWVMLPLYESDFGKEVRVALTPLYDGYQIGQPEFLLGSENAIRNFVLSRALPMMILSLCVVFVGCLLLCLAIYHNVKGISGSRLYALGMMAISAGLWRVSYDRVAYLLFENASVLVYTISIVTMMTTALSMLNSLEADEKGRKAIRLCTCGYCVVYLVQIVLQISGIADLRQTMKADHLTIIISAAAFVVNGVRWCFKPKAERKGTTNYGWILGIGVVIDLALYYFAETSFQMVFTLVAILCYSILEGIHVLFSYIELKNVLKEMETQLILSRTTVMMSQIRSHFVFNVLNAISGMCKYAPEQADETVVRFARYLRHNIDIMENDRNLPFSTILKRLDDYVALEQVRFDDKIEFYTDLETTDFSLPPLVLQPVVENAIKHGISKKLGNGTIILRTRDRGETIEITVEDDGVGFDMTEPEKENSVGLRNIRFRLEHLANGTLDIQSEVGKGTTVTITIPKEAERCE